MAKTLIPAVAFAFAIALLPSAARSQEEDEDQAETQSETAEPHAGDGQSVGGAGLGTDRKPAAAKTSASAGASSGGASAPASAGPAAASNQTLSVVCGPTQNVLTWKLLDKRNSNSVLVNVDKASAVWACGGPENIGPCSNLNVNTFTHKIEPGKVYQYRHKSAPACASNTVVCPGGISIGESCTTGGVAAAPAPSGGTPSGGGGTTGGTDADRNCTGGNPECICVKNVGAYNRYEDAAAGAIEAAFPGQSEKPAGMSDEAAAAKICASYNANKTLGGGSVCRPQADEIVFGDPNAPDFRYPTISVDVVTGAGAFWRNAIAACAAGVQ